MHRAKQICGFIYRRSFFFEMALTAFGAFAIPVLLDLYGKAKDASNYTEQQKQNAVAQQVNFITRNAEKHYDYIVHMISYLDILRTKIKEIFEYYQQAIQGLLLITTLFLTFIIGVALDFNDISNDAFLAGWGGASIILCVIPVIELVFLSIYVAYTASNFVHFTEVVEHKFDLTTFTNSRNANTTNTENWKALMSVNLKTESIWLGVFKNDTFINVSNKIQASLVLFFLSIMTSSICILHDFYKANKDYEIYVFWIGVSFMFFLLVRFITTYGFVLDTDLMNFIQSTFNIETTDKGGLSQSIDITISEYNYHQEFLYCNYLLFHFKNILTKQGLSKITDFKTNGSQSDKIISMSVIHTMEELELMDKRLKRILRMDTWRGDQPHDCSYEASIPSDQSTSTWRQKLIHFFMNVLILFTSSFLLGVSIVYLIICLILSPIICLLRVDDVFKPIDFFNKIIDKLKEMKQEWLKNEKENETIVITNSSGTDKTLTCKQCHNIDVQAVLSNINGSVTNSSKKNVRLKFV